MAKTKIPEDIRDKASKIINDFNASVYKKNSGIKYCPVYKGEFLYLNRKEGGKDVAIARLSYNGKIDNWGFAIFRWSNERYDPDEFSFPGSRYLNGSIEGALKAGNDAYPPDWEPAPNDLLDLFKQFLGE